MNENLRPATLGEILDRTVQLYRYNFWLFAGVAALPIGSMIAIGAVAGALGGAVAVTMRNAAGAGAVFGIMVIVIAVVALPLYFAAYVYSTGGLTKAAVSTHCGEKVTIRAALTSVRPHFWRYLWFLILQGLIAVGIPAAFAGVVIGVLIALATLAGGGTATGLATGFVTIIVIIAAVIAAGWLMLCYSMGMAVCVVEQKTAWESLQRSWKLSQGTRGRIFVLFLLVAALGMVAAMIAYVPLLIIVGVTTATTNGAAPATAGFVVAEIVNVMLNFTLQTVLTPISVIALVLFYYDQRVRKEGFDIEWMMQQAGLVPPQAGGGPGPVEPVAQIAPASPAGQVTSASLDAASGAISGPALPPDTVEER